MVFADGTGTEIRLSLRFGGSKNKNGKLYRKSNILQNFSFLLTFLEFYLLWVCSDF